MTAALEGGEWSAASPGRTLPPGKTWYPFYRRLGGPQGRSGRAEKLVPTGIRSQTVQPVVSRNGYNVQYSSIQCTVQLYTRSDSKVMRLVPKNSFILFIHQLKYGHLESTSLVPAHMFSSGAATVCSIPGTQLEECRLRPALQTSGCLLLIRTGSSFIADFAF